MNIAIFRIIPAVLALNLCACTSFDREWRLWSPPTPAGTHVLIRKSGVPPTPQSPFDGRWVGKWTSDRHKELFSSKPAEGEVRLVFTKMDPYRYRSHFRARWMNFRSDQLVTLNGKQRGETLHLRGTQPVSRVFGSYSYDATVTPTHFSMRYDSRYDSGTVELGKLRP
jgi:hypothetical protein